MHFTVDVIFIMLKFSNRAIIEYSEYNDSGHLFVDVETININNK